MERKKRKTAPEAYYEANLAIGNECFRKLAKDQSQSYLDVVSSSQCSQQEEKKEELKLFRLVEEYLLNNEDLRRFFFGSCGGKLYTFGYGDSGQLGHGETLLETRMDNVNTDDDVDIEVTNKYQLGFVGENVEDVPTPKSLEQPNEDEFTYVSSGGLHTVAITKKGKVYGWGCSQDDSFGTRMDEDELVYKPMKISASLNYREEHFVQAFAGVSYTLVVSCKGNIFAAGVFKSEDGKKFKMNTYPSFYEKRANIVEDDKFSFSQISSLNRKVKQVSGGDMFVAVLLRSGEVLTWGISNRGFLSRPVPDPNSLIRSKKEKDEPDRVDVEVAKKFLTPTPVCWQGGISKKVSSIACGPFHMLVVTQFRQTFSVGLNNYGQLGHGDLEVRNELTLIQKLKAYLMRKVSAGIQFSCCLDKDGRIFTFGRCDSGQLGFANYESYYDCVKEPLQVQLSSNESDDDTKAIDIACGDNHCFAVTKKGDLYSWGFSGQNQCGFDDNEDIIPLPKKVIFPKKVEVLQVSGGAQASAIIAK